MNATRPVSQTPIASDPAQPGPAAADNSVNSGGKGQDFAAALTDAGPKPVRKAAGAKAADAGTVGGHLPAAGNLSPPPTPPPAPPLTAGSAAAAAAAAAATAGTVGGPIPGARVGTAAPAANALTAARSPAASILGAPAGVADQNSGTAPVDSPVAAPGAQGATSPGAGFGLALGLPVDHAGETGAPRGDRAAAPSSMAAVAVPGDAAPAKGAARAAVAMASTAQGGAAAGTAAGAANKPGTVATTAAVDSAASQPTPASRAADGSAPPATPSSTAPSTSTGASTNTDATAQAVTAAAMSAAAAGTVAPGDPGTAGGADLTALPTNESATPATAAKSSATAGPNGPPVPAPVVSVARPGTDVSAKAAATTPPGTALAGAGAADKRASGGTGDSQLPSTSVDGSAGAAQLGVNPATAADATTAPPTLKVAAGVETPEFGHGLADRVSWMVDNNLNGAKLQVNPPQLGPIEVRIAVQGSHAQVWLASHSAVTRDALESSSSKLREMLGAQGFGQVSVDISQRSYQDRSAHSQPYESMPSARRSPSTAAVQSTTSSLARISSGAVDAYA
jgi:flagellar hook-length control protein FliK